MADATPDKPAGKSWFEVSALGFDALALVIMLATSAAGVLLAQWATGNANFFEEHGAVAWGAAWLAEAAIAFWSGASIAHRMDDPDYTSLKKSTVWAAVWAAVPPVVFICLLGVLESEQGLVATVGNSILLTIGFVPGSIAGVLWWRRRRATLSP